MSLRVEVDLVAQGWPDHPLSGTLREIWITNDQSNPSHEVSNYEVMLERRGKVIGTIKGLSRVGPHRNRLMLASEGLRVLHNYLWNREESLEDE